MCVCTCESVHVCVCVWVWVCVCVCVRVWVCVCGWRCVAAPLFAWGIFLCSQTSTIEEKSGGWGTGVDAGGRWCIKKKMQY